MSTSTITGLETFCAGYRNEPFDAQTSERLIDAFVRNGCVLIKDVYTPEQVAVMKAGVERAFTDPKLQTEDRDYGPIVRTKIFEFERLFRDDLIREPMISLAEQMFGADCHMIANNCIRNAPGQAIDTFHVDDFVWFPLPDEIPRFDPRMKFPQMMVNVQQPLTDLLSVEYGPLQFVPGSHYSGRQPNDIKNPTFEGQGPVSVLCKAGDVYFQHPQVWHRGAPNTSDRTRYICGKAYARRFVSARHYPFMNYTFTPEMLEGASERLLRVMGKHKKGAYG